MYHHWLVPRHTHSLLDCTSTSDTYRDVLLELFVGASTCCVGRRAFRVGKGACETFCLSDKSVR
jgi:hypothetical protein